MSSVDLSEDQPCPPTRKRYELLPEGKGTDVVYRRGGDRFSLGLDALLLPPANRDLRRLGRRIGISRSSWSHADLHSVCARVYSVKVSWICFLLISQFLNNSPDSYDAMSNEDRFRLRPLAASDFRKRANRQCILVTKIWNG